MRRLEHGGWAGGWHLVISLAVAAAGLVGVAAAPAAADGNEAPGAPVAARSITAGFNHTCALLDDATVKCWGENGSGQLGRDNTTDEGNTAGDMAALGAINLGAGRTATAITAGGSHTCALLDNATVKCWGENGSGQLGRDNTTDEGTTAGDMAALGPINLGAGRTATAIAGGGSYTCALLDDATVKCWGLNANGQLGRDNTTAEGNAAGDMAALGAINLGAGRTATAITAGNFHACALLDDATVKCWGANSNGQLGRDNITDEGTTAGDMAALGPINLGTGRTATAITAGRTHTCALLDNATVKCWGFNAFGQLGRDNTTDEGTTAGDMAALGPINLGAGRTATAIAAGRDHTCALLDDATLKCWGVNLAGQLGRDNTTNEGNAAGDMAALGAINLGAGRTATAATAGTDHTCALLDDATLKCWGVNNNGELGRDNITAEGNNPGDMAALGPVNLGAGRTAGPVARVGVTVTADQTQVVAGETIDYDVTVTNTGGLRLTQVQVIAPDVPDCAASIGDLAPGAVSVAPCEYTTTADDIPQMTNQVLVTTGQGVLGLSGTRRTRVDAVVNRPDALIRLGAGAFAGNNTYNTTGAGQTRSATVANLGTATFTIRVQNDGNTTEPFTVKGLSTTNRYTVTYRNGPTNITAAVVAGTFTTDPLAPGATQDLTLTIKAKAGTPVGTTISRTTTITSTTDTTIKDTVKATVRRT